jgi:hypothetical protein
VWRITGASPGAGDLLAWLVVVPTALVATGWLGRRWFIAHRATAAVDTVTGSPVADDKAISGLSSPNGATLAVVASALWLPAGRESFDVIDALRRHHRPSLHATLRDLHGFPATVAEVDGLDEADADWGVAPETEVDEARRRALALLRPVAEELLLAALPPDAADAFDDPLNADAGSAMHPYAMHHSQSARAPAAQQRATLRVVLQVSADWPDAARERALMQLRTLADALGHDADGIEAHCLAVHREADAWQCLAQQASVLHDSSVPGDRLLLLATDSRVSESHVELLHSEDRLLRAGAPEGEIPGEGAAGLLLAAARLSSLMDNAAPSGTSASLPQAAPFSTDEDTAIHLHLPQVASVTAGERSRDRARTSGDLIARALALAGCDTASLQVITGADHRPSRMTEAATALVAQRPDLDPVEDALHLGVACGALGVVGPVALLALAAAQVRDTATPTLAYSLADATTRAVAVLAPAASEPHPPADLASAA